MTEYRRTLKLGEGIRINYYFPKEGTADLIVQEIWGKNGSREGTFSLTEEGTTRDISISRGTGRIPLLDGLELEVTNTLEERTGRKIPIILAYTPKRLFRFNNIIRKETRGQEIPA